MNYDELNALYVAFQGVLEQQETSKRKAIEMMDKTMIAVRITFLEAENAVMDAMNAVLETMKDERAEEVNSDKVIAFAALAKE